MKKNLKKHKLFKIIKKGFTLIELLVVISIIGLLASIILTQVITARGDAQRTVALQTQITLQKAAEEYSIDIGFYPPDVSRGWDPGISKPLPYNKDLGYDCNLDSTPCTCPSSVFPSCDRVPPLPSNWMSQVVSKWRGPYTLNWTNTAPWGGKYDYNNWNLTTIRYGCSVPAGIYIGTQRNYDDSNPIPPNEEQWFLNQGLDADNCLNGESELLLIKQ